MTGVQAFSMLICHLVGDYPLQNTWMALGKESAWKPALAHASSYMTPFLVFSVLPVPSGSTLGAALTVPAFLIMWGTHVLIDRFALVKRYCVWQNGWGNLPEGAIPESITTWIPIIWDNAAHLLINFLCLVYLAK